MTEIKVDVEEVRTLVKLIKRATDLQFLVKTGQAIELKIDSASDFLYPNLFGLLGGFYEEDTYITLEEPDLKRYDILRDFGGPFRIKLAGKDGELWRISLEMAEDRLSEEEKREGLPWFAMKLKTKDEKIAGQVLQIELEEDELSMGKRLRSEG